MFESRNWCIFWVTWCAVFFVWDVAFAAIDGGGWILFFGFFAFAQAVCGLYWVRRLQHSSTSKY